MSPHGGSDDDQLMEDQELQRSRDTGGSFLEQNDDSPKGVSDDEISSVKSVGRTEEPPEPPRIRKYPESHKGPFVVYIRQQTERFMYIRIAQHVTDSRRYKSVIACDKVNEKKVRVTLRDRSEANMLVTDAGLKDYKVYVPAEEVEVEGVIQVDREISSQELMDNGIGRFDRGGILDIKPVDVFRFLTSSKLHASELSRREGTEFVKVAFPGKVLPDYFIIYGLRIRIRPYKQRAMYCHNCGKLDHTELRCSNQTRCRVCGDGHADRDCPITKQETRQMPCRLCRGAHDIDIRVCPKYKVATRNRRMAAQEVSRKSYAELTRTSETNFVSENVYQQLSDTDTGDELDDADFPPLVSGNPRKRRRPNVSSSGKAPRRTQVLQEVRSNVRDPRKGNKGQSNSGNQPPGFQNVNEVHQSGDAFDPFRSTIISFVNSLQIESKWKSIIRVCVNVLFDAVLPLLVKPATYSSVKPRNHV